MTNPAKPIVEAKVKTSSAAATAVGAVLALVSAYVFKGTAVPDAVEAIVTSVVGGAVTGGITFATGWLTKHTPRGWIDLQQTDE
ncbi:hypothetical protein [Amycolatopsis thermoflava]|uniref:hypothetical protein n=1 Tax=Amycolatopsis thermoflava TaxID=84480 RepID=UPI003F4A4AB1